MNVLPPPIRDGMFLAPGLLSKSWTLFFQDVQKKLKSASDMDDTHEEFVEVTDTSITLTSDNFYVICNNATGVTVTLPPLADMDRKLAFIIVNIGAGTATVTPSGSELIYDETSLPLYQYDSVQILNASTYWGII